VIADCHDGRVTSHYQPGHPHAFLNCIYMAELHHNVVLFDRDGTVARLREATVPYPAPMRDAIVRTFGWEAGFALDVAGSPALRGNVAYVSGCLYRAAACMAQVLFAANERYLLNEKRGVPDAAGLERVPDAFAERVEAVLAAPGGDARELTGAIAALRELHDEVRAIASG
jgi:hypothetical protein